MRGMSVIGMLEAAAVVSAAYSRAVGSKKNRVLNRRGARLEKARTRAGPHTTVGPVSRPAGPARWEQPEDTTWSPASCYLHAGPATVGPDRVRAGAGPLPEVVRVDSGLRHDTARAGITVQPSGQLAVAGSHHRLALALGAFSLSCQL